MLSPGVAATSLEHALGRLSVESRNALGASAVFRGGFDLAAFADVVLAGDRLAAMELLQSLRDESLLQVVDAPGGTERRFLVYEHVRAHAERELIEPLEMQRLRLRHAEWFVTQAVDAGTDLAWIALERENLLAARETGLALGSTRGNELALSAVRVLESVYETDGSPSEYLQLWDSSFQPPVAPEIEMHARLARGRCQLALGGFVEARADFEQATELAEGVGRDDVGVVGTLESARASRLAGAATEAEFLLSRARAVLDRLPDPRLEQRYRIELASLRADQGLLNEALELEQASLGYALTTADPRQEAEARLRIALRARALGRVEQADEHMQRAHELFAEPEPEHATQGVLIVAPDVAWVELVPGARIDLARRDSLRGLVAALIRARRERPGQGLSIEALFQAGWPGAQIRPESQAARVYVAINSLKKLGFGGALTRQDDGYLLVPGLSLQNG
jgi:tetratricopeptide (TPR) repeat protein